MIIKGIQKTSMVDYPGLLCATLFTPGCNLRCPFCHNAVLVTGGDGGGRIEEEDVLWFLEQRKGRLDAVTITGGEPLLQDGIPEFVKKIRDLGYRVKLDTNGCFPDKLYALTKDGLFDYVAMDIKNSPALYGKTVGIESFDISPVLSSIEVLKSGETPYEFRTTVSKTFHTEQSLREAGELIRGAEYWYLQAFKDSGNILGSGIVGYDEIELQNLCKVLQEYAKQVILRGV